MPRPDEAMFETTVMHLPVLPTETIAALAPRDGGVYLDGTVGLGGHAELVLRASAPGGLLIGLDRDEQALAEARERLAPYAERTTLLHASYADAAAVLTRLGVAAVDGLLLDLGVSSLQLDDGARGFSFRFDAPLDMRFDPTDGSPSAADLVNDSDEAALAEIIWRFGEERHSRRIARAIIRDRPLSTTAELARVVEGAIPGPRGRTSPATRTFQALRIAVNGELSALEVLLAQASSLLAPGGRLAVIAFHSLEDRIVKQFMQRESRDCVCPPSLPVCICEHRATFKAVTHGAVQASTEESARNPRARSARLRAAERI
jgi:16S rRNA (cytosine1402-N4)-methyltransferase